MAARSTSKREIHGTAAVSVVTNFVLYVLSHAIFHGRDVPPEVAGFVMLAVSYGLAVGAGYLMRRRRIAAARDAQLLAAAARSTP